MNQQISFRYRLKFEKTEAMRYTGNLDLHRTLERTIRRSNLPLAYSQGFNPRPKLTLASALPLGYTSKHEEADIWLQEEYPSQEIHTALSKSSPPRIKILSITPISLQAPKLQNSILSATFTVTLPEPNPTIENKIGDILSSDQILLEKTRKGKTRTYDLRAFIISLKSISTNNIQQIEMTLSAGEGRTGRPDEVLQQIDIDPFSVNIQRTQLSFKP